MFWQKTLKEDKRTICVLLFAIIVLIGLGIGFVALTYKLLGAKGAHHYSFDGEVTEEVEVSPAAIVETYKREVNALINDIDEAGVSSAAAIELVEQGLMAMRVPQQALENHLQAVLALQNMKESGTSIGDIQDLLGGLIIDL